ncbi:MAG: DUF1987 domain-containing protein [Bacteroidales bacterium]
MGIFKIEQQEDTPQVSIDFDNGIVEFKGKSLPEDSTDFFRPVEDAVRKYLSEPQPTTIVSLQFDYLNSSSQKRMLEIVSLFEDLELNGKSLEVIWFYPDDDDDILDEGKEFARMLGMNIAIKPIN